MNDVKVSIIIPVYNTSLYVNECIESALSQTLKEIEIICIDDGSTDGSLDILREYEYKYPDKVRIFENEVNKGLSETRNVGIDAANGEFIYFLDSDDYIAERAMEICYKKSVQDNLDVYMFSFENFTDDENLFYDFSDEFAKKRTKEISSAIDGLKAFTFLSNEGEYYEEACYYLIRRTFLLESKLKFAKGVTNEEVIFTFGLLWRAKRVECGTEVLYKRRLRPGSITTSAQGSQSLYGYFLAVKEYLDCMYDLEKMKTIDTKCMRQLNNLVIKYLKRIYVVYNECSIEEKLKFDEMMSPKDMFLFDCMKRSSDDYKYRTMKECCNEKGK